jgi:alkanesulfonate monooxygenase SsuD/methylene tetrahydromethanopterin reductase-like flavin-dependent oxidoreductase (luciferase family)
VEIGIFQLLPAPAAASDRDVVEQALWEVDFAEDGGFGSVWMAEHHASPFGLIGSPSVYAAAVAQRTRRIEIGFAVAVVPLHHPLRLAEEIAWVDQLSRGRLVVGCGPGFSPHELGAFGVPLGERHARLDEGLAIVRGLLANEEWSYAGRFWSIPPVTLRPRPYRGGPPLFLRASSSPESLRQAALDGMPPMFGLAPGPEIAERVARYRALRSELGAAPAEIERAIAEIRVLRRVALAPTDGEAAADARRALEWETATAQRVHGLGAGTAAAERDAGSTAPEAAVDIPGGCIGTPESVLRELLALRACGIRHVIAWLDFGDMPYAKVRRSMELLRREVLPELGGGAGGEPPTGGPGERRAIAIGEMPLAGIG